jgi:hypothetical protein
MARVPSILLAAGVTVAAALGGGAARTSACGPNGYSYAGLGASERAFGISATVRSLEDFDLVDGHVAGWVGVGSPGEGPGGTNEWLQVGISRFPGVVGSDIYYEVALPGHYPAYHQVESSLSAGEAVKLTVLEMHAHPERWRVALNGRAVSPPIHLPRSYDRWAPMATAESWEGGKGGACNSFLYDFRRLRIAHAAGGGWRAPSGSIPIESSRTRIHRSHSGAAFLAAEGHAALRLLPTLTP